jgi:hydrogenase maturation protease
MLFAARLMDITPSEMCLIGIQPKSVESGIELSDEITARFESLLGRVLRKLKDWGVDVIPKTAASP